MDKLRAMALLVATAETGSFSQTGRRFGLSQPRFAALLGISTGTLQNWEQGRREPDGPARVLLQVAAHHPEALLSVARATSAARKAVR